LIETGQRIEITRFRQYATIGQPTLFSPVERKFVDKNPAPAGEEKAWPECPIRISSKNSPGFPAIYPIPVAPLS
jgi:hypothetical protein